MWFYPCVCMCMCACACVCVLVHVFMYACMRTCVHMCTCVCVCVVCGVWCGHAHSLVGSHSDGSGEGHGSGLLPTKSTTKSLGPGHNPIGGHAQGLCSGDLGVVQPLCGAYQLHLPVLPRGDGYAAMGLQVEVVLPPHVGLPLQGVLRLRQCCVHISVTDQPLHLVELLGCYGVL